MQPVKIKISLLIQSARVFVICQVRISLTRILCTPRLSLELNGDRLIVLRFNETSTLVVHFMSSPRAREKRDRRDSSRYAREGQGRDENDNKGSNRRNYNIPPLPVPAARTAGLAQL